MRITVIMRMWTEEVVRMVRVAIMVSMFCEDGHGSESDEKDVNKGSGR